MLSATVLNGALRVKLKVIDHVEMFITGPVNTFRIQLGNSVDFETF